MDIVNKDLTEISLDGAGTFDVLIQTVKLHLQEEFSKGRITGPEYSQVYLSSLNTTIQQAITFLLGKDTAAYQAELLKAQILKIEKENLLADKQLELADQELQKGLVELQLLNKQLEQAEAQAELLRQKTKTEKAQVLDTIDGEPVAGVIGKQKNIYQAQADGFTRQAEQQVAKLFADMWSVQRSTDDTYAPYTSFEVNATNAVFDKLKQGIGVNA